MSTGAPLRLLCPEYRLPGDSIAEKWEHAARMGYDGIELAGPAQSIHDRFPQLKRLVAGGALLPTVSSGGRPFIGERDPQSKRSAVSNLKLLLSAIAELGGVGVTTPACFGLYSRAIPALNPGDDPAERQALIDALGEVGQHASAEGVVLLLEPLNRYEDHHINRLEQALELIRATGTDSVKLLADVFHMNMEEADLAEAIRRAGPEIHHVQLADSNRLEPGAGHLDFASVFRALQQIGYERYCALECRLSDDARTVLPRVSKHLREVWRSAAGGAA